MPRQQPSDTDMMHHEKKEPPSKRTTRVCIKNVPLAFTTSKLMQHLQKNCSSSLEITDCKILKTQKGASRRLAFVGLKSPEMALRVVQDLDQTYALTSKINVELALDKKNATQPQQRPWSKYSVGSSRHLALVMKQKQQQQTKETHDETNQPSKEPQNANHKEESKRKQDFLSAMMGGGSNKKRKFWSNDDDVVVHKEKQEQNERYDHESSDRSVSSSSNDGDSNDDSNDMDSVDSGGKGADVLSNFANNATDKKAPMGSVMSDMDFFQSKVTPVENLTDDEQDHDKNDSRKEEDASNQLTKEANHDTDSSTSCSSSSGDDDSSMASNVDKDHNTADGLTSPVKEDTSAMEQSENDTSTSLGVDPLRLFCRNLPFTCTEQELQQFFSTSVGKDDVVECHMVVDDLRRNKGYAFVSFSNATSASQALQRLDGTDFQGRLLHIMPATKRAQQQQHDNDEISGNLTFKQKVELKRKQNALLETKGVNASFVRGDAVVDNLSDRLGITKEAILNVKDDLSAGDAAVRLALGETHIIQENRDFFSSHNIDMDALVGVSTTKKNDKRSTTSILVKNLPYDKTTLEDLTKLFHGVVAGKSGKPPERILLPPSKTIALVEYGHAVDARYAFKKLAYKRFKHVPLYLEWAPQKHFASKTIMGSSNMEHDPQQEPSSQLELSNGKNDEGQEEAADTGTSHTIFVKNLNFSTREDELRQVFEKHVSNIRAVKILTKVAPIKSRLLVGNKESSQHKDLSLGYGFVECDSEQSVRKAIKALQGTLVDGHALELKPSTKQLVLPKKQISLKSKKPTKIMVRNVPFQATRKELLQLFGSFGQLKKVRLPKKFDGTHRGFAFVEFVTSQEALGAMQSLSRTHLYGRHLVLEWASDDTTQEVNHDYGFGTLPTTKGAGPPKRLNKKIRFH